MASFLRLPTAGSAGPWIVDVAAGVVVGEKERWSSTLQKSETLTLTRSRETVWGLPPVGGGAIGLQAR